MQTKLCGHETINGFGLEQHEAGGKLLPILKACCPFRGRGPGFTACQVNVVRNESGNHEWTYVCLAPSRNCPHLSSESVRYREKVAHDKRDIKHLVDCTVEAAVAFTPAGDNLMKYKRCAFVNTEATKGSRKSCNEEHFVDELRDGKKFRVKLSKDENGDIVRGEETELEIPV